MSSAGIARVLVCVVSTPVPVDDEREVCGGVATLKAVDLKAVDGLRVVVVLTDDRIAGWVAPRERGLHMFGVGLVFGAHDTCEPLLVVFPGPETDDFRDVLGDHPKFEGSRPRPNADRASLRRTVPV